MGLLYQLTRKIPASWLQASPTTLEELLDQATLRKQRGANLTGIDVVPTVIESDHEETMFGPIPARVDYCLEFVAFYADGRKTFVREHAEGVWLRSYDSTNIAKTEAALTQHAESEITHLRERGYDARMVQRDSRPYNLDALRQIDNSAVARDN